MSPDDSGLRIPNVPAVVLGSSVSALGVVRALRAHDVTTHVVVPRRSMVARSNGVLVLDDERLDQDVAPLLGFLHDASIDHAVLFPCDDGWLDVVARLESVDSRSYPASVPKPDAVERLTDKGVFAETLNALGIPRPRTFEVRSIEDLRAIADGDLASFFLKPRDSQRFTQEFNEKGIWLTDRGTAISKLERALANGHALLAQERIEGPPGHHVFLDGFVDRHGEIAGIFARRRVRMFPPGLGNSTDTVTIPLADVEDAVVSLRRLFGSIAYRGMFDAEFKRDETDGAHKIIEVNARAWWQIELARAAGVDVVRMAYLDALGLDVAPARRYRIGRRWVHTFPDLRARLRDPGIQVPDQPRHDGWFSARHAVFRLSDPRPVLSELARVSRVAVRLRRARER
jgi:D-aspartate ligase